MNLAHAHLLLNHIPIIGLGGVILILLYGFARHSDEVKQTALTLLVLVAIFAIPVYFTGEPAEEIVEHMVGVEEPAIEAHEEAALVAFGATALAGLLAVAGLVLGRRAHPAARPLTTMVLILSLGAGALMAWTAGLGGRIRHPEARPGFEVSQNGGEETEEDDAAQR